MSGIPNWIINYFCVCKCKLKVLWAITVNQPFKPKSRKKMSVKLNWFSWKFDALAACCLSVIFYVHANAEKHNLFCGLLSNLDVLFFLLQFICSPMIKDKRSVLENMEVQDCNISRCYCMPSWKLILLLHISKISICFNHCKFSTFIPW